ncbi:glycosyltransferase family 2 protein [Klebsiella aerogenes]|uniref:glycosyltransferase family 2 protein n=1 Tax=Klebsiella aerogenes TaxID=548 RepID=UPI001C8D4F5E|nr:glycosyltransferase family 2 protein [Klebsiella aerogenes]ELA0417417.1 glycosyltransferase family 2 protein [Klebsiella aerogenes]MDF0547749.1 glycosyltransferase family 2 protein [Klebsiella aerogenes]HBY1222056.1 glycosyltransferase family 2 protein [Klebsiella aerogenes]HBY9711719.1 glycosyltransferase family 2 protein [Klebsiella aerogenes]HDH0702360.1 glycosyltransferase family 2 protein [Klebsiella aerogenes]
MNINDKIAVLLCTYNGEKYLKEQIDSIINQTYKNWVIYVSDDGSTDGTIAILEEYQRQLGEGRLHITHGPRKGFAWNFISSLQSNGSDCNYFAFCDQDDIWYDDKLERGVRYLASFSEFNKPAVYCGRTQLIDGDGHPIGFSPLFGYSPSFCNALVQSIAGGNTMILNHQARELVSQTPCYDEIISHDWWIYILVSGCNGHIYYDPHPAILYRQHGQNIIGSNISMTARLLRIRKLMDGKFKNWNQKNIDLLMSLNEYLTPDSKIKLGNFIRLRSACLVDRLRVFCLLKPYRQTTLGNIALFMAVLLKKL